MPSSHGARRKSRSVMSKRNILRGLSYLLVDYQAGDKLVVDIDSREHTTTPHRRFQGRMGVVKNVGKRIVKISVMLGGNRRYCKLNLVILNHWYPQNQKKTMSMEEIKS